MANLKIDSKLSDVQNLMKLIAAGNPDAAAKLTEGSLTFAAAVDVQTPDAEGRNTTVVATAAPEFEYFGSVELKYRRLVIATETALAPVKEFNIGRNQDIAALIAEVEAAWDLVPGHISMTLPDLTGADHGQTFADVEVTANAGNLLYVENILQLVTLVYQEPSLATLITVLDLMGFDPVAPAEPVVTGPSIKVGSTTYNGQKVYGYSAGISQPACGEVYNLAEIPDFGPDEELDYIFWSEDGNHGWAAMKSSGADGWALVVHFDQNPPVEGQYGPERSYHKFYNTYEADNIRVFNKAQSGSNDTIIHVTEGAIVGWDYFREAPM